MSAQLGDEKLTTTLSQHDCKWDALMPVYVHEEHATTELIFHLARACV